MRQLLKIRVPRAMSRDLNFSIISIIGSEFFLRVKRVFLRVYWFVCFMSVRCGQ